MTEKAEVASEKYLQKQLQERDIGPKGQKERGKEGGFEMNSLYKEMKGRMGRSVTGKCIAHAYVETWSQQYE